MIETEERALVNQLVAHAVVEALDIAILRRSSRQLRVTIQSIRWKMTRVVTSLT